MGLPLLIHVGAGGLALLAGYTALYARKGTRLHRSGGKLFVYAMLVMATFGGALAFTLGEWAEVNVPASVVSAYLVVTALLTVRPATALTRRITVAAMLLALGTGATMMLFAAQAIANGGVRNGIPAFPFFLFGTIGLLGAAGDVRMLRAGPLEGSRRIARHLWRMCTALFVAALSFFIGQADVIPAPLRILPLLALPVLAVILSMGYWLWRVRARALTGGPGFTFAVRLLQPW